MSASPPESTESPFRLEALAHHRRAASAERLEPLRISAARIDAAYRGVGVLLLLAVAALCLVRVDARVRGRFDATRAPDGTDTWAVAAVFPWRYRTALVPGRPLLLIDDAGCLSRSATIVRTRESAPRASSEGSRRAEPDVTAYAEVRGTACSGRAPAGAVEVTLDTAPLITVFFPGLREPISRLREAL